MSFTSLLTSSDQQHYQADPTDTIPRAGKSSLGERRGYAVPKFDPVTSPSLPRGGGSAGGDGFGVFSPSSYFALPHGLSPSALLDSPVLLSASNILPSPTTGTLPAQAFDWKQDNIIKRERNSFPDFSFQTQIKPQTSYGQESSWFYGQQSKQQEFAPSEKPSLESDFASNHSFSPEIATIQTNDRVEEAIPSQNRSSSSSSLHTIKDPKKLDDGYNWRKYGQKQVKGSENPRSYYKCTHPSCPTKKKVEITVQGHITEIVYKGTHNHPKPQSTRRSSASSQSHVIAAAAVSNDNVSIPEQSCGTPENSTISMENDDFEQSSHHKRKLDGGDEEFDDEDELNNAKRWKGEAENEGVSAMESRTVKEPRVVVQTLSDIDILDDGFRWRKYGQKVVKGNPNPRSYYKCTYQGCNVRKHVERSSQDPRAVITTYEGKHNHDVPAARGSGRSAAAHSNSYPPPGQENITRPSLLEAHNVIPHTLRYENSLRSRMDSMQEGNGGGFFFKR